MHTIAMIKERTANKLAIFQYTFRKSDFKSLIFVNLLVIKKCGDKVCCKTNAGENLRKNKFKKNFVDGMFVMCEYTVVKNFTYFARSLKNIFKSNSKFFNF